MKKKKLTPVLLKSALLFFWIFFVLYPNPVLLAISISRLSRPPINSIQVNEIIESLDEFSPLEVEEYVYKTLPYRHDWEVYGMPWYFPALEEVLENGRGDCKTRYSLLASLLENQEIPYEKRISLTHIWVHYEGKIETAIENNQVSVISSSEEGGVNIQFPRVDLGSFWRTFVNGFWEVMPLSRKIMLFSSFPVIFGALPVMLKLIVRGGNRQLELPEELCPETDKTYV